MEFEKRYRILTTLGSGGAATVYLALDQQLRRQVAIKVLRPQIATRGKVRERFLREGRVLARLQHPNLVRIHDLGEEGEFVYLVMEPVEGRNLGEVLAGGPLGLRRSAEYVEAVARAVHHAHEQGVVHRDLKPENVLVTPAGQVRVLDFGLAHLLANHDRVATTQERVGTPHYMAPEQVDSTSFGEIGPWTDVHALGAILYACLAGRPPYSGRTLEELYARIAGHPPPPPSGVRPGISGGLERIVLGALAKEPAGRYPSAAAMADDLRSYLEGRSVGARRSSVSLPRRSRSRVPRIALAAAGLLAAAVGASILALADPAEPIGETSPGSPAPPSSGGHEPSPDALAAAARARRNIESAARLLETATALTFQRGATGQEIREAAAEARDRLEEARASGAPESLVLYHLGRAWDLEGRLDEAETCWRRAIELAPDFGPVRFRLGRLLLDRAHARSIRTEVDRTPVGGPQADREAAEGLLHLEAALSGGNDLGSALVRRTAMALAAWGRGDPDTVGHLCRQGLVAHAGEEGVEELLCLLALVVPQAEAIGLLDEALSSRPHFPRALFARGTKRIRMRDAQGALEDLDHLIELGQLLAHAHYARATVHQDLRGDLAAACLDFEESIRLDPEFVEAYFGRGYVRQVSGDIEGSIADYDEAIRLRPDFGQAFKNRGLARARLGDFARGLADLDRAISLAPRDPDLYSARGSVRFRSGDREGARVDWESALRLAPTDWAERESIANNLRILRGE